MKVSRKSAEVLEEYFDDVRFDYSGRGMYGGTCVGIVTDSVWRLQSDLNEARQDYGEDYEEEEEDEEVYDMLTFMLDIEPSTDNMGLDLIFYWTSVRVEE